MSSRLARLIAERHRMVLNEMQGHPLCPNRLRIRLLRLIGAEVHRTAIINSRMFLFGRRLVVERGAFINSKTFLEAGDELRIGEDVRIAPGVQILTTSHAIGSSECRAGDVTFAPVSIGRGTWIGAGAIILQGVVVASGCIVGSGSVVTRSTEPNGFYAGQPARRVRDLP